MFMKHTHPIETVIYGGAFNPPTRAHVAILQACFEYAASRNAEVWIMPSGNRRDKHIPVSRERRLEYIDALVRDAARTERDTAKVITTELDRVVSVETADTVAELSRRYPDRSFTFVFGADSTATMAEWKDGELLLATLSMLVIEREGSCINPLAKYATPLRVTTSSVSSTQVRALLASGGSIDELVTPSVAQLFA